ncbi:hypothetical protein [Streptomyces litchfieldiae]|uniref:Uncharacterized protein n=1 Tax=Streptomyces litchfieldiae TaxID=3075543 RepID=A0ABU2MTX1_9ACTN|nr:hypothetical protein [Streptomyces sp. DSM 44938]MDT0345095.1 hypothetical protein [Streptomyces sp. DSM 44938]
MSSLGRSGAPWPQVLTENQARTEQEGGRPMEIKVKKVESVKATDYIC